MQIAETTDTDGRLFINANHAASAWRKKWSLRGSRVTRRDVIAATTRVFALALAIVPHSFDNPRRVLCAMTARRAA